MSLVQRCSFDCLVMANNRKQKLLRWALVGLGTVVLLVATQALWRANARLVQERYFRSGEQLRSADGPVNTGWLPEDLPTEVHDVHLIQNHDSNVTMAKFRMPEVARAGFDFGEVIVREDFIGAVPERQRPAWFQPSEFPGSEFTFFRRRVDDKHAWWFAVSASHDLVFGFSP